jgi:hypothetical protein
MIRSSLVSWERLSRDEAFGLALTPDTSLLCVTLRNVGVVRILDATNSNETQQVEVADVGDVGASARGGTDPMVKEY